MSSAKAELPLWSLRGRLIKLFAAGGFSAWVFTALLILPIAERENTDDRDAALKRAGIIVMALAQEELLEDQQSLDAALSAPVLKLPGLTIQVLTPDGHMLFKTAKGPSLPPPAAGAAEFADVTIAERRWRVVNLRDESSGIRVQIGEDDAQRREDYYQLAGAFILPLVLGLPLVMMVAWLLGTRALRPLRRSTQALLERESSDLSPIQPGELPDEALPLVSAFNKLLGKLAESWDEERRFAASVAHELRTPLAGIRLNLQRLQRGEEQLDTAEHLASMIKAVDRATGVIEQLLTLAGLEQNRAREQSPEKLHVRRIIEETLGEFGIRALQRHIRFETVVDIETLMAPSQAFYLVLRNFVENAIRHAPDDSTVKITTGRTEDSWWWLSVEDAGPGLQPTVALPSARSTEGFQIGLSLVRKIAEILGGKLESGLSESLGGASFRFSAPMHPNPSAPSSR